MLRGIVASCFPGGGRYRAFFFSTNVLYFVIVFCRLCWAHFSYRAQALAVKYVVVDTGSRRTERDQQYSTSEGNKQAGLVLVGC